MCWKFFYILFCFDFVGGELNVYMIKEEICLYVFFVKGYFNCFVDLFVDIVVYFNFLECEFEKEKDIILDEFNFYLDIFLECIFDDFEKLMFFNYLLGNNILGICEIV